METDYEESLNPSRVEVLKMMMIGFCFTCIADLESERITALLKDLKL